MDTNGLKNTILGLLPDNLIKLINPFRHRSALDAVIDFFFGITGDPDQLQTSDKSSLVNAINEIKSSGGGGGVSDFISLSDTPNDYTGEAGKVVAVNSSEDGLEFTDGGVGWTAPTDKSYGIWDTATGKIINSKLAETSQGAELNGRFDAGGYVGKNVTSNIDGGFAIDLNNLAEHYFLTQTDNVSITFTNMITANQTAVITITLTGTYTFTFPSWLKPLPYNDAYDGNKNNEIVINIKRGGSSPLGYYSLTNLPI